MWSISQKFIICWLPYIVTLQEHHLPLKIQPKRITILARAKGHFFVVSTRAILFPPQTGLFLLLHVIGKSLVITRIWPNAFYDESLKSSSSRFLIFMANFRTSFALLSPSFCVHKSQCCNFKLINWLVNKSCLKHCNFTTLKLPRNYP